MRRENNINVPVLLSTKEPTYVWYADKPPRLGGVPRQLTLKELETIIHGFFYTEQIYGQEKNPSSNPENMARSHDLQRMAEERFKFPLTDKLVICYIDEIVGHGLFAREFIAMDTVVAVYSGELIHKSASLGKGIYRFCVGADQEVSSHSVDAEHFGGLARFCQSLPYNPDNHAQKLIPFFKQAKISEIKKHLRCMIDSDPADTDEQHEVSARLLKKSAMVSGEMIYDMCNYKINEQNWELKALDKKAIQLNNIVYANLECFSALIKNIPMVFLKATCNIQAGEQVGFPYGINYWLNQKFPRLFDSVGRSIPLDQCGYERIPVRVDEKNLFYFDKAMYATQQNTGFPVQFVSQSNPVSFFYLRRKMVQQSVLPKSHAPLDFNSFALHLKEWLPSDIKVEIFNRYPDEENEEKQWIVDAVISIPDRERWEQLTLFFRESSIKGQCKCFQITLEILIQGVNTNSELFGDFIHSSKPTIPVQSTTRLMFQ